VSKLKLFYRLASWSLGLLGAGIALRFVAEPMIAVDRGVWLPVGVLSTLLQIVAVGLFIANTGLTRYRTGQGLTWQTKFVFASLGWWMLVALAEPWAFAQSHQADRAASVAFVAEWFSPLREAQFLGFVANMIFGVALVKMSSCFGAESAHRKLGNAAFFVWNLGLIVRAAGWVATYRADFAAGTDLAYRLGGVALAVGAMLFIASSRMFEPLTERLPAQKFVRAAFGWLAVAGGLLMLERLHLNAIGAPFSHPYTGAIRHAVTVGFISQMILGVGMHVVARMNDVPTERQSALWATFWLLNIGNASRVALEIATDYTHNAFLPMGFTGFVELTGLALWGSALAITMIRGQRLAHVR
jgi:hypothetical protein